MNNSSKSGSIGVWGLGFGAALFVAMVAGPHLSEPCPVEVKNACILNLEQIDSAKDEWALENIGVPGDPVAQNDIDHFMYGQQPQCPDGGTYSYNAICHTPTCSIAGPTHELPSQPAPFTLNIIKDYE